jgi:alpha,alpha-trehalose phosphorylase
MIKRDPVLPPEFLYPIDDWRWVERAFAPQYLPQAETIFAVANGYLGMRGAFEEGGPAYRHGTFVNGFHATGFTRKTRRSPFSPLASRSVR